MGLSASEIGAGQRVSIRLRCNDGLVGFGGIRQCNPGETDAEDRRQQSHRRLRISFLSHGAVYMRFDPERRTRRRRYRSGVMEQTPPTTVIPAKAGTHAALVPAFAGMTVWLAVSAGQVAFAP